MAVGDPLRKVVTGERLQIPASAYNAFIDAAQAHRNQQFDGGGAQSERFRQGDIVRVRNDSGRDAGQFDVLGIDGPLITPADGLSQFKERVALSGSTPTSDHFGNFCVLLEPVANGKMGRGYMSGVTVARVQVEDDDHKRADVNPEDPTSLKTVADGSAWIIWKGDCIVRSGATAASGDDSTLCWAVVRLSNPPVTPCEEFDIQVYDIKCVNGRIEKWVRVGTLTPEGCLEYSDPLLVGYEGCCACDGGGGSGGSGSGGLPAPSGTSGGSGSSGAVCCGGTIPDVLCATVDCPTCPGLDGRSFNLGTSTAEPPAGTCGSKRGAYWAGAFCAFPLSLICCTPSGDCTGFRLVADVVPRCDIYAPDSCSNDPFILVFSIKFRSYSGGNPQLPACLCQPYCGQSTCEHDAIVTITEGPCS